jgi:hypothetical protein
MKPSANRISLLRRGGGGADARTVDAQSPFLSGLHQPFGMALAGSKLYIADTDALLSFDYAVGTPHVDSVPQTLLALPAGGYNNHWTRNLIANRAGTKLYVTVGSGSDHAEDGLEQEAQRADILELNPDGSEVRVFASGIRNPVGLACAPNALIWSPGRSCPTTRSAPTSLRSGSSSMKAIDFLAATEAEHSSRSTDRGIANPTRATKSSSSPSATAGPLDHPRIF